MAPEPARAVWCCSTCGAIYHKDFPRCPIDGAEVTMVDRDPLLGSSIGHYQIEQLIGEGGMGRVYLASHANLPDKRYAFKVLLGDHSASAAMRARFTREAERASQLDHPNVARVVDFGATARGLLYIVMDYVDGPSLVTLIGETPMAPARVVALAREICRGLIYAHAAGIVHRDLKPENILVTLAGAGSAEIPRLVDFGLAMSVDQRDARLTESGMTMGTPAFAAPEQLSGKPIDHRADLYALGMTMFEMLTGGRAPIDGSVMEVIAARTARDAPRISERAPGLGVPAVLDDIVARLTRKKPAERYASARAVIEAFDAIDPAMLVGPAGRAIATTDAGLADADTVAATAVADANLARGDAIADAPTARAAHERGPSSTAHLRAPRSRRGAIVAGIAACGVLALALYAIAGSRGPSRTRSRAAAATRSAAVIEAEPDPPSATPDREHGGAPRATSPVAAVVAAGAPGAQGASGAQGGASGAQGGASGAQGGASGAQGGASGAQGGPDLQASPEVRAAAGASSIAGTAGASGARAAAPRIRASSPGLASDGAPVASRPTQAESPRPARATAPPAAPAPQPAQAPPVASRAHELQARLDRVDVSGSLPHADVERAVLRWWPQIKRCVPAAPATVITHFTIGEARRASEIRIVGPTSDANACLAAAFAEVRTQAAPDVGDVEVAVVITFAVKS